MLLYFQQLTNLLGARPLAFDGQKTPAAGFTHAGKVDPLVIAATPFAERVPIGMGSTDIVIVFPVGLVSILIPLSSHKM